MKILKLLGSVLGIILLISGCKKDSSTSSNTTTAPICTMTMEIRNKGGGAGNDTIAYAYDSSKKLVTITTYSRTKDTIIYTLSGQFSMVKEFSFPDMVKPSVTWTYTYSGSNITQIIEKVNGYVDTTYIDTTVYVYSGSQLSQIKTSGFDHQKISGMTWFNGNLVKANYEISGVPVPVTITFDSKKNNSRFTPPFGSYKIDWFCANNMVSIQADSTVNLSIYANIAKGTKLFENSNFTYNINNELTGKTELGGGWLNYNGNPTTHRYLYECQ